MRTRAFADGRILARSLGKWGVTSARGPIGQVPEGHAYLTTGDLLAVLLPRMRRRKASPSYSRSGGIEGSS